MDLLLAAIDLNPETFLGLVILILDIIVLVSVLSGRGSTGHKVLWTILIILLPCLGLILYYFIGRSPADADLRR